MKKIMIILAAVAAIATTGCKSVEVQRHASSVATVEKGDGTVEIVKDKDGNPIVLDGGWNVDYFQHWNWQKFDSLSAQAGKDVSLSINGYVGGASASNLTALVSASFSGGAQLAIAIGEAYTKIAGGGAQAATVTDVASKVYNAFTSSGGDVSKATVTTDSATNTLTVTDGTTSVTSDAAGNVTTSVETSK